MLKYVTQTLKNLEFTRSSSTWYNKFRFHVQISGNIVVSWGNRVGNKELLESIWKPVF